MRIDSSHKISDIPILQIRKMLRYCDGSPWDINFIMCHLDIAKNKAINVIDALESHEYVEKYGKSKRKMWISTLAGNALALASASRPIKRTTADRLVKEFLERLHEVNEDDYFLYKVSKVLVFGSYLTKINELGDIDLALGLQPKHKDHQFELDQERLSEAIDSGRHFSNIVEQLGLAQIEVRMYLKNRSKSLSIHSLDDEILNKCETRILFKDTDE